MDVTIRECNFAMGTILEEGFAKALVRTSQHLCLCKTLSQDCPHGKIRHSQLATKNLELYLQKVFMAGLLREKCIERGLTLPDSGGNVKMRAFLDSLKHACKVPNTEQPFACLDLMFLATLVDQLLCWASSKALFCIHRTMSMAWTRTGLWRRPFTFTKMVCDLANYVLHASYYDEDSRFKAWWPLARLNSFLLLFIDATNAANNIWILCGILGLKIGKVWPVIRPTWHDLF